MTTQRPRVLVVDDEPDVADVAKLLLNHYGFEVSVAYSPFNALRILESGTPIDVLFSDVMMPGMNGLELAAAARKLAPTIKVVLTSGVPSGPLLAGHGRTHFYAPKPYRIETIVQLLSS